MALEHAVYINALNPLNPAATDGISQADDHMRLIKNTIKLTFPNVTGPISSTHTELNHTDGVTSNIQTQLNAALASTIDIGEVNGQGSYQLVMMSNQANNASLGDGADRSLAVDGEYNKLTYNPNDSGGRLTAAAITCQGSFSKGSGSFKIDHPLPAKADTHHLVHSFVEGPQADNIYRGTIALVDGAASVNIDTVSGMSPGTFSALNGNVQCFTSSETGYTAVKGSVSGNVLDITAVTSACTETVSWMVVGERIDPHMISTEWTDSNGKVIVEPAKE